MAKDMSIWSLSFLLDSTARGINRIYRMKKKLRKCYPCTHHEDQRKKSKATKQNNKSKFGKKEKIRKPRGKERTKGGGERKKMMAQLVKKSTCNVGDMGLIPGLGRCHGEGNDYHASMGSSSVDSNSWKYMGETFQKVLNNKTWICYTGNYITFTLY